MTKPQKPAVTAVPISEVLTNRWSPRAYDPNHEVSDAQILGLAEAARWAPSGNNAQPWRFAFLKRSDDLFTKISETALTGFNQSWAPAASLYVVALADKFKADGSDIERHGAYFNNALATSQIVLEAEAMGLKAHYMGGVIHDEILSLMGIDDAWVTCVITIGAQGDVEAAAEAIKERDLAPRERKALREILVSTNA